MAIPKYQPRSVPQYKPKRSQPAATKPAANKPAMPANRRRANPPPPTGVPEYGGPDGSTYDFPGNGEHYYGGGVVEQAPFAVGPVEARAASIPQYGPPPAMRTRQGPTPIMREGPTYLGQMATDYAANRPDWENPQWSYAQPRTPARATPSGLPPYPPTYYQSPATYNQYGIPQYGGPLVANPYYEGDDYAQRPSYAEYSYEQSPNLSRGVKESNMRGSGKRPASSGKVSGGATRTTALPAYQGGSGAGGDLPPFSDGGGGYGGGGGGGEYEPPPWYYGLMTWRF